MKTTDILARVERGTVFINRAAYVAHVRRLIVEAGERPIQAQEDQDGNCQICGECGFCPGWHTRDDITRAIVLPLESRPGKFRVVWPFAGLFLEETNFGKGYDLDEAKKQAAALPISK